MASQTDLAEQLHPVRLPADFFAISMSDLLAAFGVGILAAVALYLLVCPFTRRRKSAAMRVAGQLREIGALPSQERLFRQAAILAELREGIGQTDAQHSDRGEQPPEWKEALYRPGVAVDHEGLDERILRIAAQVKT